MPSGFPSLFFTLIKSILHFCDQISNEHHRDLEKRVMVERETRLWVHFKIKFKKILLFLYVASLDTRCSIAIRHWANSLSHHLTWVVVSELSCPNGSLLSYSSRHRATLWVRDCVWEMNYRLFSHNCTSGCYIHIYASAS